MAFFGVSKGKRLVWNVALWFYEWTLTKRNLRIQVDFPWTVFSSFMFLLNITISIECRKSMDLNWIQSEQIESNSVKTLITSTSKYNANEAIMFDIMDLMWMCVYVCLLFSVYGLRLLKSIDTNVIAKYSKSLSSFAWRQGQMIFVAVDSSKPHKNRQCDRNGRRERKRKTEWANFFFLGRKLNVLLGFVVMMAQ